MTPEKIGALERLSEHIDNDGCDVEVLNEAIAELRGNKEQVRCGGCRFGDDYGDSKGKCKCDLDYGWHTKDWYCADADGKKGEKHERL